MYKMEGLTFFLLFLGGIFLFILLCTCGLRACVRAYDTDNQVGRAVRRDFRGV